MRTRQAALVATLATGFSLCSTAVVGQVIDEGVFEIRRQDALVAEEEFRVERTNRRQIAVTIRSTARYFGDPRMELTALIELDAEGFPVDAQFDRAGATAERTMVTVSQRAVSFQVLPEVGENVVLNFRRPAGLIFLSNLQLAPFLVRPVPGPEIKGMDLTGRVVRDVTVTDGGEVAVMVGDQSVRAHLVSVSSDGGQIHLWYVDNRLVKVEVPAFALSATRRVAER